MRCDDEWYNEFLGRCRYGRLDREMYNFFHGHPTLTPGSLCPQSHIATCTSPSCSADLAYSEKLGWYKTSWRDRFLDGMSGQEILATEECEVCKKTRRERTRVIPLGCAEAALHREPFTRAPAVFSCNVPKYFAVLLRAREFAKQTGRKLSWCVC